MTKRKALNAEDPLIIGLKALVSAANEEFDHAVRFHQIWKPAAYDKSLHKRIESSHAAHGFLIVRTALRRETILALMRMWDKPKGTVRLDYIAEVLRTEGVIEALAVERSQNLPIPGAKEIMQKELQAKADEAAELIDRYSRKGSFGIVREMLTSLRHEYLAHRKVASPAAPKLDVTDKQIETFYQDTAKLVSLLMGLVRAIAYDTQDTADLFAYYARLFWEPVRSERTEGHPSYRKPPASGYL